MKTQKFIIILSVIFILINLQGCYYDKNEKFKPVALCDTTITVTYTANIKPIIDQNCTNNCHSGNSPSGGISLDSYAAVKAGATPQGKLYSSLTWDGTTSNMPKGSPSKIDDCSIKLINKWINTNYAQ